MHRTIVSLSVAVLLQQVTAGGLIGYLWTFDELKSKSALIVIAVRGTTKDTGIRSEFTEVQPPYPVVELNTEFNVLTTLKGKAPNAHIVLRHFWRDAERMSGAVVNAPAPLEFSNDPTAVYLLFLKHESGDRYAPTSGRIFPDVSVVALPRNSMTMFPQ